MRRRRLRIELQEFPRRTVIVVGVVGVVVVVGVGVPFLRWQVRLPENVIRSDDRHRRRNGVRTRDRIRRGRRRGGERRPVDAGSGGAEDLGGEYYRRI